jgi:membrane-associated PAP2 superfamily phosphatase
VLLALIGTLPFWLTDLDLRVAALWYHPDAEDPWWESNRHLWVFLYQASPVLVSLMLIGSLLTLAATWVWTVWRRWRRYAVFVLVLTLLGPGLVINGVIKDYWGRPRPHQTVELGGTLAYVPPLVRRPEGKGMSFPSGHSAVGFALGGFFLIWQRRRPRLAWTALLISAVLGALIGAGRMIAGDHFLSDVIWSAVLTYGVAWVLYWFVLRIPQREQAARDRPLPTPRRISHPTLVAGGFLLASIALLYAVLLATPVQETRTLGIRPLATAAGPRTLRLVADEATLTLFHLGAPAIAKGEAASIRFKGRGFGLPASRVHGDLERTDSTLTYTVTHAGVFTEKDSTLIVGIDPSAWDRIEMTTQVGDIRILPLGQQRPHLALTTGQGTVLEEDQPPGSLPPDPTEVPR